MPLPVLLALDISMLNIQNLIRNLFNIRSALWSILLIIFLNGCVVPSIQPLYTHAEVVFEESMLGEWEGKNSVWTFEKKNEHSYYLTYREGSDPINDPSSCTYAEFEVHLVQLENNYFLDFLPINYLNTENLFLLSHLIETHSFAKIDIQKNRVSMTFFDYQWLEDLLERDPDVIEHIRFEENIVLTADTKELQEFVKAFASDEEALTSPFDLKRMSNP